MRITVISCLVFVNPLLMKFWKVQPSLPKYLEFVTKFLYVYMFVFVIAVRFTITFGFKRMEFKFVSYKCTSYFFSEVRGKSCFIECKM